MINYVSVNSIFSKIYRELPEMDINENDTLERIQEALEFINLPELNDEKVVFIDVEDYECPIPKGLKIILQLAKKNNFDTTLNAVDITIGSFTFKNWLNPNFYREYFSPIRLANSTFL